MTLHWWMHWFWVTAQIVVSLTSPTTSETSPTVAPETTTLSSSSSPVPGLHESAATRTQDETTETLARLQQSYRIAKAIGIQPTTTTTTTTTDNSSAENAGLSITSDSPQPRNLQQQWARMATTTAAPALDRSRSTISPAMDSKSSVISENKTSTQPGRIPGKKETKITWIHAFSKPPRLKTSSPAPVSSEPAPEEELTVMPLQEDRRRLGSGASSHNNNNNNNNNNNKDDLDPNAIRREQLQQLPLANRSEEVVVETGDSHAIATASSVPEAGLADSTRLGRARDTFTSEFQRDQLSRDEQPQEETIKETASTGANVTEIATITGSCLAIIVLLSTLGSVGFVMYRKKYLNPPQTLNSDKCSNPDSSGYIDDSTIRDNSEEMYSLDNDSFLNSLEAMTIQNYWTDSVKHTKL